MPHPRHERVAGRQDRTEKAAGDSKKETDETYFVDLFGNTSNLLFTKNRAVGTILNDD
jgi:hypothetical protein